MLFRAFNGAASRAPNGCIPNIVLTVRTIGVNTHNIKTDDVACC